MFEKVFDEIRKYNRIIIHRHQNPDGDALGSQTGLKLLLLHNFPEKEICSVGDMSRRYGFIEGSRPDAVTDEMYEGALAIILDTASSPMISDGRYTLAARTVRIDHHLPCERIADIEVVDPTYESTSGLVAELARECGLELTPQAAKALYVGIITDSGRFRYDSTSARTFSIASFLMSQPFSTADIYKNLYSDDFSHIRLRAKFILKIRLTEKRTAYIYTTANEVKELGADIFTISRGMVNTMSDIKGVDIWANFTETEEGVLCEIRSNKYNINPVAVKYGGGGHAKASGVTLKGRKEAMRLLRDLDRLNGGENE